MIFCVIAEVVLASFAVFGLYVLIHLLLCNKRISVALEIDAKTAVDAVPLLLRQARESYFLPGCERVVALVDGSRIHDDALFEALKRGGAEIYIVEIK